MMTVSFVFFCVIISVAAFFMTIVVCMAIWKILFNMRNDSRSSGNGRELQRIQLGTRIITLRLRGPIEENARQLQSQDQVTQQFIFKGRPVLQFTTPNNEPIEESRNRLVQPITCRGKSIQQSPRQGHQMQDSTQQQISGQGFSQFENTSDFRDSPTALPDVHQQTPPSYAESCPAT